MTILQTVCRSCTCRSCNDGLLRAMRWHRAQKGNQSALRAAVYRIVMWTGREFSDQSRRSPGPDHSVHSRSTRGRSNKHDLKAGSATPVQSQQLSATPPRLCPSTSNYNKRPATKNLSNCGGQCTDSKCGGEFLQVFAFTACTFYLDFRLSDLF